MSITYPKRVSCLLFDRLSMWRFKKWGFIRLQLAIVL